ncbi:hypothetical protein [Halorussus litoreus]|uniref:hypothetical protein n=1 Tax=Halorussus litoreus TaxID=1710536 RepID=UPI001E33762C|nr:hypothetical protein [Halorussus litoreus]
MPSRRAFLRGVGGVAALGTIAASAAYADAGFVRTKVGGSLTDTIDLESPDDDVFVAPGEYAAYADRLRGRYDTASLPWSTPRSLAGEFVGAFERRMAVVPDRRLAVQDAAVLVHRLDDARYRLRLWSAGRLLGTSYRVDPWGLYREDPGFTWLEHGIDVGDDDDGKLSANRSLSTDGGRVEVAEATVPVPDGSFEARLADDARYRTRWDGFRRDEVLLVGSCELSFADGEEREFDWSLSNGVGIRTPF